MAARNPSSVTLLTFAAGALAKFEPVTAVARDGRGAGASVVVTGATTVMRGAFVVRVIDVVGVAVSRVVVDVGVDVEATGLRGAAFVVDRVLIVRTSTNNSTGLDQMIHLVLRSESKSFGIDVVRYWAGGVKEMVHLY